MGLINLNNKNPIIELWQEIEASSLPVILFGASLVGEQTCDYFANIGINVNTI